jgi:hypothetical protein
MDHLIQQKRASEGGALAAEGTARNFEELAILRGLIDRYWVGRSPFGVLQTRCEKPTAVKSNIGHLFDCAWRSGNSDLTEIRPSDDGEDRQQDRARPCHEGKETWHRDPALDRNCVDHQVGGIADIGQGAHAARTQRGRRKRARVRAHQFAGVAAGAAHADPRESHGSWTSMAAFQHDNADSIARRAALSARTRERWTDAGVGGQ